MTQIKYNRFNDLKSVEKQDIIIDQMLSLMKGFEEFKESNHNEPTSNRFRLIQSWSIEEIVGEFTDMTTIGLIKNSIFDWFYYKIQSGLREKMELSGIYTTKEITIIDLKHTFKDDGLELNVEFFLQDHLTKKEFGLKMYGKEF